ncbi:protein YgfX [Psychromonas aquatilis]|uniref:Protein YgfX n=1 Tax=Psychromonas aquatilis TaxID=2005072 RepID=A0ABU9GQM6_9GAMM
MSSLSALKYKIVNKPSFIAKLLAIIVLLACAILLLLLWGVSWISGIILVLYLLTSSYLVFSLKTLPFICRFSERADIEVQQPISVNGRISSRSFYNAWVIFLCVEQSNPLALVMERKDNKPNKWFVVFKDSIETKEFYLLARLIKQTKSA